MAGNLSITDFSKQLVVYPSLDGNNYTLPIRSVYVAGGATNLVAYTNQTVVGRLFPAHRAAHTYIHATDGAGNIHKRRVAIDPKTPSGTPAPPTPSAIDGLTGWVVGGYVGEKIRGTI